MRLTIPQDILSQLYAHCRDAYPQECCGAFIGRIEGSNKVVARTEPLENAEPDSPERRFVVDPRQLAQLERVVRTERLAIVGFYHSHPDSPARPSATDLEWAWPVYSYMIVSVAQGEIADTRSYELDGAGDTRFVEERIDFSK